MDKKTELIEEPNLELFEKRGRQPRKKRFQVRISIPETKSAQVRQYYSVAGVSIGARSS